MIKTLSRRTILLAAAAAASPVAAAAQDPGSDLHFLVIGDWGDPNARVQRSVAAAMGRVAADMESDFVVSTGDNFYRQGVRSTEDPQWRESFEDIYAAPSLQIPWYVVLGNHDYEGSPAAEVDYTRTSTRWRMPSRYWRQDMTTSDGTAAAFFFIDTTPIVRLVGLRDAIPQAGFGARDQVIWLERELAACTAPWKFVVGHHPIFSSGAHGPSEGVAAHVRPLLERYGVQAYFNGHDHDLEHLNASGVDYVCSGSGSEVRSVHRVAESRFVAAAPGFVACTLRRDALDIAFIDDNDDRLYETTIVRRA
ncbi:MAG: purple acid phosphatase family protein [Hyphomonadaceae bacterium]